jgi:hypothetical protein
MPVLARLNRRAAKETGNRALRAAKLQIGATSRPMAIPFHHRRLSQGCVSETVPYPGFP